MSSFSLEDPELKEMDRLHKARRMCSCQNIRKYKRPERPFYWVLLGMANTNRST